MLKKYGVTKQGMDQNNIDRVPENEKVSVEDSSNEWNILQHREELKKNADRNPADEILLIQDSKTGEQKEVSKSSVKPL